MERHEALAALVALPEVSRISVTRLRPSDVLVVECDQYVSAEIAARIEATLGQVWPGHKIAVFDKSMRLKVVAGK